MPFPTDDLRPKHLAAWMVCALVALSGCEQSSVSNRHGQAQGRAQTPRVSIEPAIPAPSRAYRSVDIWGAITGKKSDREAGIRVGLLLPLSGKEAALGQSLLRAAQMALFDVAKEGFVLLPYDTEGTPEGAALAAQNAIKEGATILLGPVFSTSVELVAPIARSAGVNVVAFSNNRAVARQGTYLLGLLPRQQVERVVQFARSRGILRFAALVPDSDFGRQVEEYLQSAVVEAGGIVAQIERYGDLPDQASDAVRRLARYDERQAAISAQKKTLAADGHKVDAQMMAELESIDGLTDLGYDALLLAVGGGRLKEIAALLPFYDIDTSRIQVLGLSSWQMEGLGREKPLIGSWFAAPSNQAQENFVARYKAAYGRPPDPLAMLAYDAAALAAVLAQQESGPNFTVAALTNESGFIGTTGIFRFLPSGESQRGLAVFEIGTGDFREISAAPETFESLVN